MSSASLTQPEILPPSTSKPRKRLRARWLLAALGAVILACAMTPQIFRFGIRHAAIFLAQSKGINLSIGKVDGSIFEPVLFYRMKISALSAAGTRSDIEIARMDVRFSWASLLFRHGAGFLPVVAIDGLNGRFVFQPETGGAQASVSARSGTRLHWPERLIPSKIDATRVNLAFELQDAFVRLENLRCSANNVEPGILQIDKVIIAQPWLEKTFSSVNGTTSLQNSQLSIANVSLQNGIEIAGASSDLAEMSRGRLKINFDLAAFDGAIRGEIKKTANDPHSLLEANGDFAQISVPALAVFFEFSGEAGGVIKEGKFTFSGSPRNLEKATLSVRLEATGFRLGKRQWDSLIAGATMVDRHVQIRELQLKQAHNALNLKGEMSLPAPGAEWWQSDFAFDLAAKIDNLTELSALLGPGFEYTAGKITIDGSIKCAHQSFDGALAVSGSNLSYRGAPLDTLRASIKLAGNELQVASLEFSGKNDFLRGKGVVNILGPDKRYWGELKASLSDLSRYSALLQKPIVPEPPAGGLTVEWSGDGVSKAHSGAFHAQLKKFRLISVTEPKAHPLNADMEATYSPGNIFFSKFVLWDNETSFSAKVTAAPKTLNLQSIRLQQRDALWLEGDALLPFNVWSAWQNASWATLLDFDAPCKVNLIAKNLDLRATALLSGREPPVKGELQMNLNADGTLNNIKTSGKIQLKKCRLSVGDGEPDGIGADADLSLDGQDLDIERLRARFNGLEYEARGKIHFKNPRDPDFDIGIRGEKIPFPLCDNVKAVADADLNLRGTFGEALLSGTAQLLDLKLSGKPDAASLVSSGSKLEINPVFPFNPSRSPFSQWEFEVAFRSAEPAKILMTSDNEPTSGPPKFEPAGSLTAHCALRGRGAAIRLSGRADFQNVPVGSAFAQLAINGGTLQFFGNDAAPWFALSVSGKAGDKNLTGWIFGQAERRSTFFMSDPPLSQDECVRLIKTGFSSAPEAIANLDVAEKVPLELKQFSAPAGSLIDLRTK